MAGVARYVTPKPLPRVRAIYESHQEACQPELVAYFVRVDPAYADRIFHSHSWDMQTPPPRCTLQYFNRTPPLGDHAAPPPALHPEILHPAPAAGNGAAIGAVPFRLPDAQRRSRQEHG